MGFVSALRGMVEIPESSTRRFLRGAGWSFTGDIAARGLVAVTSVVAARSLGRIAFGQYGIIQSTVAMFVQYAGFGLGLTATKHVAEYRFTDLPRAGRIASLAIFSGIVTSSILGLAMLVLSPVIGSSLLHAPSLGDALLVSSALLFVAAMIGVIQGVLSGLEDFRAIAAGVAVQGIASMLLMWPLIRLLGLQGSILALLLGQCCCLLFYVYAMRRVLKRNGLVVGIKGAWSERNVLRSFAIPTFLSGSLIGPASWISTVVLATQENGFGMLAGYTAANQWRNAVVLIPMAMRRASLPMLASFHGSGQLKQFRRLFFGSMALNAAVATGIAGGVVLLSPLLLSLYGGSYRSEWVVLAILAGTGILETIEGSMTQLTSSLGKMWWELLTNGLWAVVLVGGAVLFAPVYGARGLALALLLAAVAHLLSNTCGALMFIPKDIELSELAELPSQATAPFADQLGGAKE